MSQPAPGFCERFAEGSRDQRRDERAEDARQADGDGVGQREADVPDGEVEGRAADAVGHAHQEAVEHRQFRRFGQNLPEMRES